MTKRNAENPLRQNMLNAVEKSITDALIMFRKRIIRRTTDSNVYMHLNFCRLKLAGHTGAGRMFHKRDVREKRLVPKNSQILLTISTVN